MTPFDLMVFVKVCSEKPFRASLGFGEKYELYRLRKAPALMQAITLAKEHMKTEDWPKFWSKQDSENSGGLRGIPWALSVIANLVKHGVSHDEAIHLPEAYALWLSTALGVHDGAKIDVLTSDQEELLDSLSRVEPPAP